MGRYYGKVIFMGYEQCSINIYNEYINKCDKNIIYTYSTNMSFEKHQAKIPFEIYKCMQVF